MMEPVAACHAGHEARVNVNSHARATLTDPDISDSRSRQRYVAVPPLQADFNGYPVLVYNLAEAGMQIEHSVPFKLALHGNLRVAIPGNGRRVTFHGFVVWSRLSKTPDETGKYLYRSGLRLDVSDDELYQALQNLIANCARPEVGSLDRKRQAVLARARSISRRVGVKVVQKGPLIPNDVVLLVQQAIERLRMHPDEAAKWYNRAKFSTAQKDDGTADELAFHYKADVLAVWEYLERTIDVNVISKIFEMRK